MRGMRGLGDLQGGGGGGAAGQPGGGGCGECIK